MELQPRVWLVPTALLSIGGFVPVGSSIFEVRTMLAAEERRIVGLRRLDDAFNRGAVLSSVVGAQVVSVPGHLSVGTFLANVDSLMV